MRMKWTFICGVVALMLVVSRPVAAQTAPNFLLPSAGVTVLPGGTASFLVSVNLTDPTTLLSGYEAHVQITADTGGSGVTLSGATDDTSPSYLLYEGSDPFNSFWNNPMDQGGGSTVNVSPNESSVGPGTYTMMKVTVSATSAAQGTYTLSFLDANSIFDNELSALESPYDHAANPGPPVKITVVPEPATLVLLVPALAFVVARRRRVA